MRYLFLLFSLLLFASPVLSADTVEDRIKLHNDALVRDVTCGVVTEFAIRDVNLLIAQMDAINPDNQDKGSITKDMIAMLAGYKLDLAYHAEELIKLGVDKSKIDALIAQASITAHQRYILFYMKSVDLDVAKIAISNTISEQGRCSDLFVKEILPGLQSRKGQVNG